MTIAGIVDAAKFLRHVALGDEDGLTPSQMSDFLAMLKDINNIIFLVDFDIIPTRNNRAGEAMIGTRLRAILQTFQERGFHAEIHCISCKENADAMDLFNNFIVVGNIDEKAACIRVFYRDAGPKHVVFLAGNILYSVLDLFGKKDFATFVDLENEPQNDKKSHSTVVERFLALALMSNALSPQI